MRDAIEKQGVVKGRWILVAMAVLLLLSQPVWSQDSHELGSVVPEPTGFEYAIWGLAFGLAIVSLLFAFKFYHEMKAADEGDEDMIRIAKHVQDGAWAYLQQQYKVVAIFFAGMFVVFLLMALLGVQSYLVAFAFLTGGFFSGLAGFFGMKTATMASSRTAAGAKVSLNQGLQVAFKSGAVMGFSVVGLGLLDITLWYMGLRWFKFGLEEITVTMLCFGMGASAQALFARVGGGIFTKAADVGADLVGKVEAGIPEDDPRNPATIADNVGDNVGDVAGMGADLYESYCGSILASAALGVAAMAGAGHEDQVRALLLPMALGGVGILLSIVGVYFVKTEEGASQKNLLKALARGINLSSILVVLAAGVICFILMPAIWIQLTMSIVVGLVAGLVIGHWTERSTSEEYAPTQRIAKQAETGPATVIIAGIGEGMYSVWVPICVIGAAILLAFGFPTGFDFASPEVYALGLYGVGIAAVGMLSTLGITLATDAYGPIADNAGGNAEMTKQDPIVRERTDQLDSLGNTTAATGKGFAIGSAALTALALLAAYIEEVRVGFDRWGASVQTEQDAGEFIKLGHNLILEIGETSQQHQVHLVFDPLAIENFDKTKNKGAIARSAIAPDALQKGSSRIISLHDATIPDFARYYDVTLMNPKILVGMFLGVMLAYVFSAMTMQAVGRSANSMVMEVRRQFRDIPGIMEGKADPEYASCVAISTKAAQKEMILPALLGLVVPVIVGVLLGVGGVIGLLAGGLTSGFALAIMMANSGGAWDNAKKYIETGKFGGKGSEAHKAGVVGDTVGDPFKDTSGPSLNILIKLMSMVSVVFAGLIVRYSLQAMGVF